MKEWLIPDLNLFADRVDGRSNNFSCAAAEHHHLPAAFKLLRENRPWLQLRRMRWRSGSAPRRLSSASDDDLGAAAAYCTDTPDGGAAARPVVPRRPLIRLPPRRR
jgi:hypothetical protein